MLHAELVPDTTDLTRRGPQSPWRSLAALAGFALMVAACGGAEEAEEATGAADGADATVATVDTEPDVWLADMTWTDGRPTLANLRNGTDRPGYDSQPHFMPDGSIYYTQIVGERADIWRLDPATGANSAVTSTLPESEYSATATPDGTGFTSIRVEADSLQRLWHFNMDGTEVGPVFETILPVGYHAWADDNTIAMFILGNPATLQVATVGSEDATLIAERIGRSINRIPGRMAVTYPRTFDDGRSEIWTWGPGEETAMLVEARPGSQDHTWAGEILLQPEGGRLMGFNAADPDAGWFEVADFTDRGLTFNRLSVNGDRTIIALVGQRAAGA